MSNRTILFVSCGAMGFALLSPDRWDALAMFVAGLLGATCAIAWERRDNASE